MCEANLFTGSAPTDPNFQTVLSKVRSIYAQIGVELGDLTYIDITGADAVSFTDVQFQDLGALCSARRNGSDSGN